VPAQVRLVDHGPAAANVQRPLAAEPPAELEQRANVRALGLLLTRA